MSDYKFIEIKDDYENADPCEDEDGFEGTKLITVTNDLEKGIIKKVIHIEAIKEIKAPVLGNNKVDNITKLAMINGGFYDFDGWLESFNYLIPRDLFKEIYDEYYDDIENIEYSDVYRWFIAKFKYIYDNTEINITDLNKLYKKRYLTFLKYYTEENLNNKVEKVKEMVKNIV